MSGHSIFGDRTIELIVGGAICVVYGYLIVIRKMAFLHPLEKWAILILRKFYGDDRADAREIELRSPKRLRRNGWIALFLGVVCFAIGMLSIIQ